MLEYNDIKNPILLGTNLWNTKSISKRAGNFSDRLIFVDTATDFKNERANQFYLSFEKDFGRKPESYESIAFETAKLLRDIIEQEGIRTRTALKDTLQKIQSYPGIMGSISVNEIGDIERPLQSLKIEKGSIKSIKK